MAHIYDTTIHIEYQGFYCEKFEKDEKGRNIFRFRSNRKSSGEVCPYYTAEAKYRATEYARFG